MKSNALLGLAVSALSLQRGETRTFQEMQDFCEAAGERISRERLRQIENKALRRFRHKLYCDKSLREALSLFEK